jgi:hypothetical protein
VVLCHGPAVNTAAVADLSIPELRPTEWTSLRDCRHNLLIEGPVAATHDVLRRLEPHLRQPVVIFEDVAALGATDQRRLLARLDGPGPRAQVISTAEQALYTLVTRGQFDEALYYRLNVMLLRVRAAVHAV